MALYKQTPKKLIDIGIEGDDSTGDIIYDGGVKVNENTTAMYNVFGDQRLYNQSDEGVGRMIIHSGGYWQKLPTSDYITGGSIEMGSRHDFDTTTGTFKVLLPKAKRGEMVEFINSNGSFAKNKFVIEAQAGEQINGKQNIDIWSPFIYCRLICTNDTVGDVNWDIYMKPLFGDYTSPVDITINIEANTTKKVNIFRKDVYDGVKLMMFGAQDTAALNKTRTLSEVLLMIDRDNVYSTEYSTLVNNTTQKRNFEISFGVEGINVIANITAGADAVNLALKTIETISKGII